MTLFAEVVLPVPLRKSFLYIVPEEHKKRIQPGSRVLVPFGKNLLTGYITDLKKQAPDQSIEFKEITEVLDREPLFSPSYLCFTRKLSDHYFSSWGEILQISLPPSFTLKTRSVISVSEKGRERLGQDSCRGLEKKVLEFLTKRPYTESYLRRKFNAGGFSSLISRLKQRGWISIERELKRAPQRKARSRKAPPAQLEMDYSLDSETKNKANQIKRNIGKNQFCSFLLAAPRKKREAVYLYLIREALAAGLKTLYLVPEIGLTDRILKKFEKKLGEKAAFLHSRLSEKQRELTWKRIKKGEADVVVGPRSVILTPVDRVGLVILDEEHEDSFYQKESPAYDARVGARLRAENEKSVLIYGSENPSVELFYRSKKQGSLIELKESSKDIFKKRIIDSRKQPGVLSQAMKNGIKNRVEKKKPVLLFFNRHGYASSLVCSRCDFTPKCQNCEVLLTYYKKEKKLVCRYCQYSTDLYTQCPRCGASMVLGPGFGIEVLEEELRKSFPSCRIRSLHKFTVKKRGQQQKMVNDFRESKIDILLGTQMLAHQPQLPKSQFIGIFYPESLMRLSDFKAGHKTFRYIREKINFVKNSKDSELLVQTYLPNSPLIQSAVFGDSAAFYDQEIRKRRMMGYPPFKILAELLFFGRDLRAVAKKSRKLLDIIKQGKYPVEVLGPSFAPIKKLRGKNRVQVIVKSEKRCSLDRVLREAFEEIKTRKSVYIYE